MIEILNLIWFIFPAYVASSLAVLTGGKYVMDYGKNFRDGNRLLGDGKTWSGFFGGIFLCTIIIFCLNYLVIITDLDLVLPFSSDYLDAFIIIFLLAFGSMIGDLIGSFIKRRMNKKRGEKSILLDPLGLIIFAWIVVYLIYPSWFLVAFGEIWKIAFLLLFTPIIHRITNIAGYKLGKKSVPW